MCQRTKWWRRRSPIRVIKRYLPSSCLELFRACWIIHGYAQAAAMGVVCQIHLIHWSLSKQMYVCMVMHSSPDNIRRLALFNGEELNSELATLSSFNQEAKRWFGFNYMIQYIFFLSMALWMLSKAQIWCVSWSLVPLCSCHKVFILSLVSRATPPLDQPHMQTISSSATLALLISYICSPHQ